MRDRGRTTHERRTLMGREGGKIQNEVIVPTSARTSFSSIYRGEKMTALRGKGKRAKALVVKERGHRLRSCSKPNKNGKQTKTEKSKNKSKHKTLLLMKTIKNINSC